MSVATGLGLAAGGLVVGLAAPKLMERVLSRLKPGGKFSEVS